MKNIAIILLAIVFVASAVSGVIFYRQSNVKDQELMGTKENLLSLKQSEQNLKTQLQNKDDFIGKLQGRLETEIKLKDQELMNAKENFLDLKQSEQDLKSQLQNKNDFLGKLQSQLEISQTQILSLQDQAKQLMSLEDCQKINTKELDNANRQIVQLEGELALKDQELMNAEENFLDLKQSEQDLKIRLQERDDSFGKLQNQFETLQAQILSLQDQTEQKRTELMSMKNQFQNVREEKDSVEIKIEEIKSTYNALVNKLQANIDNQEAMIKEFEKKLSVTFIDRVLFGFGEASITPEGKKILKNVGDVLKNLEDRKIQVIGHTDNIPIGSRIRSKFPTNWELSSARAASVVRFFQNDSGLDPGKMECVGRSFYQPIISNTSSEGRAKNRRVEIIIAPIVE